MLEYIVEAILVFLLGSGVLYLSWEHLQGNKLAGVLLYGCIIVTLYMKNIYVSIPIMLSGTILIFRVSHLIIKKEKLSWKKIWIEKKKTD